MHCILLHKLTLCMQAKLQEVEKTSTEQAAQISSLREELTGSLADLDQVRIATRSVSKGDTGCCMAPKPGWFTNICMCLIVHAPHHQIT